MVGIKTPLLTHPAHFSVRTPCSTWPRCRQGPCLQRMRAPQAGEKPKWKPASNPSCWERPSTSRRAAQHLSPNPCPCVLPPLLGCRGVYEQSNCCFSFLPATPKRAQVLFYSVMIILLIFLSFVFTWVGLEIFQKSSVCTSMKWQTS